MDYKQMWERLRSEMNDLQKKNVPTLAPAITLAYMDFILELQLKLEREAQ